MPSCTPAPALGVTCTVAAAQGNAVRVPSTAGTSDTVAISPTLLDNSEAITRSSEAITAFASPHLVAAADLWPSLSTGAWAEAHGRATATLGAESAVPGTLLWPRSSDRTSAAITSSAAGVPSTAAITDERSASYTRSASLRAVGARAASAVTSPTIATGHREASLGRSLGALAPTLDLLLLPCGDAAFDALGALRAFEAAAAPPARLPPFFLPCSGCCCSAPPTAATCCAACA
mmetsp:Transcript_18345/g.56906  ORF Transcript_18345/g.56906 Transcript_18345/m.56906 type:complete len:234 (+) Transcript_18345:312-1013(+)